MAARTALFGRTGATMKPGTQDQQQALAHVLGNHMTITARYEDGVFKPLEDVSVNEGTIVEVHVPSYADRLKGKSRSVGDFAFFGMWKDRTDIADSVEYISNLRRDLRG